jgi:hypothetical protein
LRFEPQFSEEFSFDALELVEFSQDSQTPNSGAIRK